MFLSEFGQPEDYTWHTKGQTWPKKFRYDMEKMVLQTNLKVYKNRLKSDRNSLSQFRSILTTGKGSADLS